MSAVLIFTPQGKRLHFGVWAVKPGSYEALGYRVGRYVPLCSTDQGVDRFSTFAPSVDRARPMCKACRLRLAEFSDLAASTTEER